MNTTKDKDMAIIIINQLAGNINRLKAMIGAYNFIAHENGSVSFRFKCKNKLSANYCKITLNGLDLYNIEFKRIHGSKITLKNSSNNLYSDMLTKYFESNTGLFLSL